jgi:hypothetical protein
MATVINLHRRITRDTKLAAERAAKSAASNDQREVIEKALTDPTIANRDLRRLGKDYRQVQDILRTSQSKPPQDQEALNELKATVKTVGISCLQDIKKLQKDELQRFEATLEVLAIPAADQYAAVSQLMQAQNKLLVNMQSELDDFEKVTLNTLQQQYDSRFSAYLITQASKTLDEPEEDEQPDRNENLLGTAWRLGKKYGGKILKPMADKAGFKPNPDVIQRAGVGEAARTVAVGIPSWIAGFLPEKIVGAEAEKKTRETLQELLYGKKEYAETGGVERQLAEDFAPENLSEKVSSEGKEKGKKLSYKPKAKVAEDTMGADTLDPDYWDPEEEKRMAHLWATPHEGFLKDQAKYEFNDVYTAGSFTPSGGIFLLFSSILSPNYGKFNVTYDYVPRESKDSDIEGGVALMADCATGLLSHSQNEVRVALIVHIARSKGWKTIEFRRMPAHLKDAAYLAARRAGFPHEAITYYGQKYSDALKKQGDEQRGVITGAWASKQSPEKITQLALNRSNLDPDLTLHRFLALTDGEKQIRLFKDKNTSGAQRAAILAEGSTSDKMQGHYINKVTITRNDEVLPALSNFDVFALLNKLSSSDMSRAYEILKDLEGRDNDDQAEVFKLLAQGCHGAEPFSSGTAILAAALISNNDEQARIKLFKAMEKPKARALVLQQAMLLPEIRTAAQVLSRSRLQTERQRDLSLQLRKVTALFNALDQADKDLVLEELGKITTEDNSQQTAAILFALYREEISKVAGMGSDEKQEAGEAATDKMLHNFSKLAETITDKAVLEKVRSEFINKLPAKNRAALMKDLEQRINPLERFFTYQGFLAAMSPKNAKAWLMTKYGYDETAFNAEVKSKVPFIGQGISGERIQRWANDAADARAEELDSINVNIDLDSDSDSESESEIEPKTTSDPIALAGTYLFSSPAECAAELAKLPTVTPGDQAFLFDVLKALGPKKVAAIAMVNQPASASIFRDGNISVFERLVQDYENQAPKDETDQFLAALVTICVSKKAGDALSAVPTYVAKSDELLKRVIPHMNNPGVLEDMLPLTTGRLVDLIKAMPNATQQEKVFKAIQDKEKRKVFNALAPAQPGVAKQDTTQQDIVFRGLSEKDQIEILKDLVEIDSRKKTDPAVKTDLNRVIRLVSASELTGKEDVFGMLVKDTATQYEILKTATKPTVPFLVARLQAGDPNNLKHIMDMNRFPDKTLSAGIGLYLAAVTAALLVLPDRDTAAKLFKNDVLDTDVGRYVRYKVLTGLIQSKRNPEAKALVDELKSRGDQTQFEALKKAIEKETKDATDEQMPEGNALRALVGLPKLQPAASQTQSQSQTRT